MGKVKSCPALVLGHLEFLSDATSVGDYSGVIEWIKKNLLNENSSTKPVVISTFFEAEKECIKNLIFIGDLGKIRSFVDAIDNEDFDKNSVRYKKLKLNQCKVLADAIKAAERFLQWRDNIWKGLSDLLKAKQDELKNLDLEEREKNFRDKPLSTSIDEALSIIQDLNEGIEENGGKTPKRKVQRPESSDSDLGSDTKKKARLESGTGTVAGGIKKRMRTPTEFFLKNYVQPKNALTCLNELMQGQPLKFVQEGTETLGAPISMTIEVNGQKYKGFGASKLSAKQAAAEAALVSFVKPPPPTEAEEDKTPWGVLARFAMFKLFNEWKEGWIGMNSSPVPAASFGAPLVPDPICAQTLQTLLNKSLDEVDVKIGAGGHQDAQANIMSSMLEEEEKVKEEDGVVKKRPNRRKTLPDDASNQHPVMLLHQMRPSLKYEQFCRMKGDYQEFTLKCPIDGQVFQGIGGNVKAAKYDLAVKANQTLFSVITKYTPTN